ncbi:MAG: hypothetical protein HYS27_07625 [Deltaproteobacteria bacterium]|nr:hypothetical protein [Deltaproteobacteria bacterium]
MRAALCSTILLSLACAPERAQLLRDKLDRATLSLADAVAVAQLETEQGVGVEAALTDDAAPVFFVGAVQGVDARKDLRIDGVSGDVLGRVDVPEPIVPCPSQPLAEAIQIAEAQVDGEATRVIPDDDLQCNRELQVLGRDLTLWSLKLGPDGAVLVEEEDDDAD